MFSNVIRAPSREVDSTTGAGGVDPDPDLEGPRPGGFAGLSGCVYQPD